MTRLEPEQLVGAWQLLRWETAYEDGACREPFGAGAQGLLLYTSDGWMTASIMAAGRRPLSGSNPRAAPDAERAAAFASYFSYAGPWRIVGEHVQHEITVALNPAMVGTLQLREAQLDGTTLTLSASEPAVSGRRIHRLVWQRTVRRTLIEEAQTR